MEIEKAALPSADAGQKKRCVLHYRFEFIYILPYNTQKSQ
jgi:hypothetical protein